MRFAPKRLSEWAAEVDAEPAPRWLLQDFLAADSLTLLSGHPKALGRKTLLAMVQALALSSGQEVASFKPVRQVPVLYFYHEGARKATRHRIRMLCQGMGLTAPPADFWFAHRSLMDLRSKAEVATIGHWCRDNKIGLVVFDTLAKSMQGSEDDAENMGRVVRGAEEARSYGISVLLLHHLSKSQASLVSGNFDPDRDLRGSSALAGAYETHQAVRHYSYSHKRADLLVQNKDGSEFAHKHRWDFLNHDDVNQARTVLHMGERISWDELGMLDPEEIRELMAYLTVGTAYTVEMLAALWKVQRHMSFDIIAKLIAQGQMESAKFGYRVAEGVF